MCFSGGPSVPKRTPAPLPSPDGQEVSDAGRLEAQRRKRARGYAATILTTPATADDPVSVGRKLLLGA